MIGYERETIKDALSALPKSLSASTCCIGALYESYGEYPALASFYLSDTGGVLCLLGSSLLLAGEFSGEELKDFCAFMGVTTISGDAGDWVSAFEDYSSDTTYVYHKTAEPYALHPKFHAFPDRRTVFTLLQEGGGEEFSGDIFDWMGDIALRQRKNCCAIGMIGEQATAGGYFLYQGQGVLAGLAVKKEDRQKGLGKEMLKSMMEQLRVEHQIQDFYLVLSRHELTGFYEKMGFVPIGQQIYLDLTRR